MRIPGVFQRAALCVLATLFLFGPIAVAQTTEQSTYQAAERIIEFSGKLWRVRASETGDPGTGCFSDSTEAVWVDDRGYLHLKMRKVNGVWCQAEVVSAEPARYGTYQFILELTDRHFPVSAVLGMFLFARPGVEIDIEMTHAFEQEWKFLRHTVQPTQGQSCGTGSAWCSFWMDRISGLTRHHIMWLPNYVRTLSGYVECETTPCQHDLGAWRIEGNRIPSVDENLFVHMNLWLCVHDWCVRNEEPDGSEFEVIVRNFAFMPYNPGFVNQRQRPSAKFFEERRQPVTSQ